jgi:hypothetical protein
LGTISFGSRVTTKQIKGVIEMKTLFLAALLAAISPVTLAAADAVPPPLVTVTVPAANTVALRFKFVPGETRRYKTNMTMTGTMLTGQSGAGTPMNTVMDMIMRQTVKSVRPTDGAATISTQIESMQMSMNGKPIAIPAAQAEKMNQPTTTMMLPTGKVLEVEAPALPAGGLPGMDLSSAMKAGIAFPDLPVKAGDHWNGSVSVGGMKMLYVSTLAGMETVSGRDMATIDQTLNGNINMAVTKNMPAAMNMTGKITGGGRQVFDTTAGALASQKMEMNMDFLMMFTPPAGEASPAGMPQSMKMMMKQIITMERIDDAAPGVALTQ